MHEEINNSQYDLIPPSSSPSVITWRNRLNWDRLNPEEVWKHLQDLKKTFLQVLWEVLGKWQYLQKWCHK